MEQYGKLYLTSDENVLLDMNYRYIISTIELDYVIKKGTKNTLLTNFEEFCKQLEFDKNILIKIIGKKLSCRSGIEKSSNIFYLVGEYRREEVKYVINNFIQNYLLCIECDKPEIILKYKNEKIKQKCKACGRNDYIKNGDEDIIKILKNV